MHVDAEALPLWLRGGAVERADPDQASRGGTAAAGQLGRSEEAKRADDYEPPLPLTLAHLHASLDRYLAVFLARPIYVPGSLLLTLTLFC